MNSKNQNQDPLSQTTDLLGDSQFLELTNESLSTVKKKWEHRKGIESRGYRPILIITTRDRLKTTKSPRGTSRFERVLAALQPPFQRVFSFGPQVVAIDTENGRQILTGSHLANASLSQNGYCIAITPTVSENKTLKTTEYQLLSTSFFLNHKKRERKELVKEWKVHHLKVFKEDDITRHLSYLFNVTERTIYNDLDEIANEY